MTQLPTDAAARKALPIMAGCFDYFPSAIQAVSDFASEERDPANMVLVGLTNAGIGNYSTLAFVAALRLLQGEITGTTPDHNPGPLIEQLDRYADAFLAIAAVSKAGNDQHSPGEPLHWARGKSMDQRDTAIRHLLERGTRDTDGHLHSAKVAWRCGANLQLELEAAGAPMARGAR